jgi:hypothetical protein
MLFIEACLFPLPRIILQGCLVTMLVSCCIGFCWTVIKVWCLSLEQYALEKTLSEILM